MPLSAYTKYLRLLCLNGICKPEQTLSFALVVAITAAGCVTTPKTWRKTVGNDTSEVDRISREIDAPAPPIFHEASLTTAPITASVITESDVTYVDRSLSEVLQDALHHAAVLRDLGGVILRSPETVRTNLMAQIQEADPRYGMEAALSAFDAQLAASAGFNKNNQQYNNSFFAGGATNFQQQLNNYQAELSKRSATGSLMALRAINNYDANNAPANTFPSYWNSWVEGEVRQPLLQGGGLEFNRIAGPGGSPGVYNGVLIAKANADINQHDFTIALTDFVSNVENAYWDLYLSYRELDARKKAMEQALVVWNGARELMKNGAVKGADEALARQQYYQLKAEVDEALSGRLLPGTTVRNGATGGTLQSGIGVLMAERRLRLLCGLPSSDGSLIRPSEEPTMAEINFDWDSSLHEALTLRPEIQKQNVALKKRELELLAARNFLNPKLDAVGRYRFRGFGDELLAGGNQGGPTPASSLGNLANGQHQEWMMGVELTVPIGYRKAHAAVEHAELLVVRERIILKEQQREIASNLGGATADVVRAFQSLQNNLNQYLAAQDYFEGLTIPMNRAGMTESPDRILDAQRRLVNAEIQFFRARAEYAVSLKNYHYEKGALLVYKDLIISGMNAPVISEPSFSEIPPDFIDPDASTSGIESVSEQDGKEADLSGAGSSAVDVGNTSPVRD